MKTVSAHLPLRAFITGMIGYRPGWVTALYHVRRRFVRLLGMRQAGIPQLPRYTPAGIALGASLPKMSAPSSNAPKRIIFLSRA